MSQNTKIQWTDATINFWWGCDKVSPACRLCYAETWSMYASRQVFGRKILWGQGQQRGARLEAARKEALALERKAIKKGVRFKVFVNSMSDWLDEEVPIEWLAFLLETIHMCPHLDFQLLTKRPENWETRVDAAYDSMGNGEEWQSLWMQGEAPPNVWIGTTVESQEWADKRIPHLLKIPAVVRFLSCEPLLGEIKLDRWLLQKPEVHFNGDRDALKDPKFLQAFSSMINLAARQMWGIHWVIAGGESGGKAVPSNPDWFRSLRDQCKAAGVAFFFKQWGNWMPIADMSIDDAATILVTSPRHFGMANVGKDRSGRLLDGKEHSEFPTLTLAN